MQAWESSIRADPETKRFEKTGETTYAFHTERFPFNGTLKVLNATIDDEGGEFPAGSVEIDLVGLTQDFLMKYARSYGSWNQNNTLYWDRKAGRWLSLKDFRARIQEGRSWPAMLLGYSNALWWLLFLGIFIALLSRQLSKASAAQEKVLAENDRNLKMMERSLQLSERSVQLNEEANALLRRIADSLKKA